MAVVEATTRDDIAAKIKDLNNLFVQDPSLITERKLLTNILMNFQQDIYDNCNKGVLSKSEMCYRSYVFDKGVKSCADYLRNKGYKVTFLPGEIELEAMTTQLKSKGMSDGRYKYNADGLTCTDDPASLSWKICCP